MNFNIQLEPMEKLARIGEINGYEAAGDAPTPSPPAPAVSPPRPPSPRGGSAMPPPCAALS